MKGRARRPAYPLIPTPSTPGITGLACFGLAARVIPPPSDEVSLWIAVPCPMCPLLGTVLPGLDARPHSPSSIETYSALLGRRWPLLVSWAGLGVHTSPF
jgi:hypothetical protein